MGHKQYGSHTRGPVVGRVYVLVLYIRTVCTVRLPAKSCSPLTLIGFPNLAACGHNAAVLLYTLHPNTRSKVLVRCGLALQYCSIRWKPGQPEARFL